MLHLPVFVCSPRVIIFIDNNIVLIEHSVSNPATSQVLRQALELLHG